MMFILRRLFFYVAAFFTAATINFFIPRLMPGNPVDVMFAKMNSSLPPEAKTALIETFGFASGPLYLQFLDYIKSVFTWNLGPSIKFYPLTVGQVLGHALPWTIMLAGTASVLAFLSGSLLGVSAAWRRGGILDTIASPSALAIQSIPAVVVALTALYVFGLILAWFPTSFAFDPQLDPGLTPSFLSSALYHAVMPVVSLAFVHIGGYLVTMRNNMIGQLGEDYVVMGQAKGLSDRRVMFNYAARNALLPSVTAFAITLGAVMGGSLVTEVVFNYPGLGHLLYLGIVARDYPLIQGQLLIMTLAMLSANLLVDLIYVLLDPRLRKA
ncbi:ABC transporter permease [Rhizobium paranaense]|uniref:Peptide/nickel transport system permease protein n=1 Tax=Rhizobium paranaense TaxID=1650438 RepID=A0A7W8XTU5_9HYPH|nr:ABC transporter permease [Rhizobium paranaense]MBB5575489.1 peptide/nickel transport system permease protein [Rhizobium paranaense]